ncbi:hypothetical protein LCW13_06070 [Cobetia amphilecti]|uniref:DUF4376 domain-containing protein n=1 Tax=Cobetia amphilecti TaxID=1055104 RepID=UPI001CDB1FC1|nr:hypothetical protein [Cobetia amphilecti]UBU49820.1 hypothetical protein LCW13_06070 [Cobetia amphilecti]
MLTNNMIPLKYRITFYDNGVVRTAYTDDRQYYEKMVAAHGHLSDLSIESLVLTEAQQQRLDEIKDAGLGAHDASLYVKYGSTESEDTGYYDVALLSGYQKDQVAPRIQVERIKQEAVGVTVNGIRYSGDASNRQAMQEALTAAADGDLDSFSSWKCSDGRYHSNHPVSEVESALREIGNRRSALIELEGQYVAMAAAGEVDVEALEWVTGFD